jgi:hypothetical protein
VRDEEAGAAARAELGLAQSGTRITVPLAAGTPPANARLRRPVGQLVQLRPVLEDPAREIWLELPGEPAQLVTLPLPEPDAERPLLVDEEIELAAGVRARVIVRRAAEAIPLSPSRATRLGGLVIRSGRAAHETTLAGQEGAQSIDARRTAIYACLIIHSAALSSAAPAHPGTRKPLFRLAASIRRDAGLREKHRPAVS